MVDEATAAPSSRAKSKSISESPFVFPKFLGKLNFPSEFRDLAEKSTLQAKENYDKLKSATEEVTGGFKDAYEAATKGTRDYGVRAARPSPGSELNVFQNFSDKILAKYLSRARDRSRARSLKTGSKNPSDASPPLYGTSKRFRPSTNHSRPLQSIERRRKSRRSLTIQAMPSQ